MPTIPHWVDVLGERFPPSGQVFEGDERLEGLGITKLVKSYGEVVESI